MAKWSTYIFNIGSEWTFDYQSQNDSLYVDLSIENETILAWRDARGNSLSAIALPRYYNKTYRCVGFRTYWGDKCVDATGRMLTGVYAYPYSSVGSRAHLFMLTAPWSYTVTFSAEGGSGGPGNLYIASDSSGIYSDSGCTTAVSSVAVPTRSGYIFKGYFSEPDGAGTQYVDEYGYLLNSIGGIDPGGNLTFYAAWQIQPVVMLAKDGGTGGTSTIYYNPSNALFYSDAALTQRIASVTPPTKSTSRFLGYYNGTTQVINAGGTILSSFKPTDSMTVTAKWEAAIVVTLNHGGGTSTLSALNYLASDKKFYSDAALSVAVSSVPIPEKVSAVFLGYYSATGALIVGTDGKIVSGYAPTSAQTLTARWKTVVRITLQHQGGATGGDEYLNYSVEEKKFYNAQSVEVTSVVLPARRGYHTAGYFSGTTGGTKYIDDQGLILDSLKPSSALTIYLLLSFRTYWYDLDRNGGEGGAAAIYSPGSGSVWYADDQATQPIATIEIPRRAGYAFTGYYTASGTRVITSTGAIVGGAITASATLTARWTAKSFTLHFDAGRGSASFESKTVTYDAAIGTLPTVSSSDVEFLGWELNGRPITASTVYQIDGEATAVASYNIDLGKVEDWFGLQSDALIPIASTSGDDIQRICVSHTGKYERGVNSASGVWRNPSVTYRVIKDTTLNLTLGKAFPGESSAGSMNVSGYMIVAAIADTRIGDFPTVTVSAVANEGADAINLFPVSIPISARAHAQNLLEAISGGGHLQAMTLTAECEPVVCEENNMPCASDVVRGRIVVTGETIAESQQGAPIGVNGFATLGQPKVGKDGAFRRWTINLQKEIV